jgi:hypothetical protein
VEAENELRHLLIETCHSSDQARAYFEARLADEGMLRTLVRIAVDAEGYLGDAPMQAAFWISRYPAALIAPHERAILDAIPTAEEGGYAGHFALTLGKIRSKSAKQWLIDGLGDGSRFDAWLFRQSLDCYTTNSE